MESMLLMEQSECIPFGKYNLQECFRKGRVWEGKTVLNYPKIAGLLLQEKD